MIPLITKLPNEVLRSILLDWISEKNLIHIRRVCRLFETLCVGDRTWATLTGVHELIECAQRQRTAAEVTCVLSNLRSLRVAQSQTNAFPIRALVPVWNFKSLDPALEWYRPDRLTSLSVSVSGMRMEFGAPTALATYFGAHPGGQLSQLRIFRFELTIQSKDGPLEDWEPWIGDFFVPVLQAAILPIDECVLSIRGLVRSPDAMFFHRLRRAVCGGGGGAGDISVLPQVRSLVLRLPDMEGYGVNPRSMVILRGWQGLQKDIRAILATWSAKPYGMLEAVDLTLLAPPRCVTERSFAFFVATKQGTDHR